MVFQKGIEKPEKKFTALAVKKEWTEKKQEYIKLLIKKKMQTQFLPHSPRVASHVPHSCS